MSIITINKIDAVNVYGGALPRWFTTMKSKCNLPGINKPLTEKGEIVIGTTIIAGLIILAVTVDFDLPAYYKPKD